MSGTGDIIKKLRESRGMTQLQLADVVGAKTYTTITKWESGDNFPKGKDIVRLSEFFNVSSDYLLGLSADDDFVHTSSNYPHYPVSISAGLPIEIEQLTESDVEVISIPDVIMGKWAGRKDIYITRVNGDSMNNVMSHNSIIAIRYIELENLVDGDVVVYSHGGGYSVKRFYNDKENEKLIFRPDSTDKSFTDHVVNYEDAGDVKLHGKVVIYINELD